MIPDSRDILDKLPITVAIYWVPALVLVVSGFVDVDQTWRTVIWAVALTTMATGCIVNAVRCGRVHCYVTGPFFLIVAVVVLVLGLSPAPLGPRDWNTIALTVLVGALVLRFVPEMFFGRYWRRGRAAGP